MERTENEGSMAGLVRYGRVPKDCQASVEVVEDFSRLRQYFPAWDDLAANALEANVFYEQWMLMPALESFGHKDLLVVLVFIVPKTGPPSEPLLCGLFPFERNKLWQKLGFSAFSLWEYIHCYLCTPLVRAEYALECLEALFDWMSADSRGAMLLHFPNIAGTGLFYQALVDHLKKNGRMPLISGSTTRALLLRQASAQAYLDKALSSKKRRKLRRQQEQLAEAGPLEYVALEPGGDVDRWLGEFMTLEASGWKGREGTALQCTEKDRKFFLAAATEAFRRGRLMMIGLQLNGQPIAQLCNFLSLPVSFAFKVAFDEKFAKFSPGVHLEIDNIRAVHESPGISTMFSCTDSAESPVEYLWPDRRVILSVLVATGKPPGDFVLSLMPLRWWLAKKLAAAQPRGPA